MWFHIRIEEDFRIIQEEEEEEEERRRRRRNRRSGNSKSFEKKMTPIFVNFFFNKML
jgi:hypothetical protein